MEPLEKNACSRQPGLGADLGRPGGRPPPEPPGLEPGLGRPGGQPPPRAAWPGPARGPASQLSCLLKFCQKHGWKNRARYSGAWAGTSGGPTEPEFPPHRKLQKTQYENGHIFCIRTPFSMILGSLESQRKALQDHA